MINFSGEINQLASFGQLEEKHNKTGARKT